MTSQRLQKILAQAGVASRRAAEHLITEGRVRVNGRIVRELGSRANPERDRVEVDGKRLVAERLVYFLMHKPRAVVTTLDDPEGRKSVADLLRDVRERVFPVGRLDFQTSGALLLTNDGELAQALLHPTRAVPKVYIAKLQGSLDPALLERLRDGVVLDDGERTGPAEVRVLRFEDKFTSLEITIAEGKNRQIHRMGEAIMRPVLRLTRISFAGLGIEGLRPGQMRPLSGLELGDLKQKYVHPPKRRHGYARESEHAELEPFTPELEEATPAREPRPSAANSSGAQRRGRAMGAGSDPKRGSALDRRGADPKRAGARQTRGVDPKRASALEARGVDAKRASALEAGGADAKRASALEARSVDAKRASALEARGSRSKRVSAWEARGSDPKRTPAVDRRGPARPQKPRKGGARKRNAR